MAAYRRVDDLTVTCRLTACTSGSALGPTLGIEYGKPLPLLLVVVVAGVMNVAEVSISVCYWLGYTALAQ